MATAPTPALVGSVALDNFGNRYTGRARIGGTVEAINPLRQGDVLSLSGLSSGGHMNYGRLGYDTLLDGAGTRMRVAYRRCTIAWAIRCPPSMHTAPPR